MSTISFDCVEANTYLSHFLERILPSDCICVSLMLDRDTNHLYLIRLEKGLEPLLIKLDYDFTRYSDEFRTIMTDNDSSMKQSDRRKFWNLRNELNRGLKNYLTELETNVFGRNRMLLLGSFGVDEKPENSTIQEFKKRFPSISPTAERLLCLKIIILGIDRFMPEQIQAELKQNFDSSHVADIEKWLSDVVRSRLVGQKRKHVCLIVDRVEITNFLRC